MKFVLRNDLNTIFHKWKYVLFFYLIIGILLVCNIRFDPTYSLESVKRLLGIPISIKDLDYVYFFFHTLFFLFVSFLLVSKDYELGMNNIFLRLSKRRYSLYKSISLFLYITFFYFFLYFLVIVINFIFGYDFIKLCDYFCFQVCYILLIINCLEMVYLIFFKNKSIACFLLILFCFLFYQFKIDYHISILKYVVAIFLMSIVKDQFFYKWNSVLFERGIVSCE